jgi:hypothetical protein
MWAAFKGVWLGLLRDADLDGVDDAYYSGVGPLRAPIDYTSPAYNRRGLHPWERTAVDAYFPSSGVVGVVAAGGGREVLGLLQLGRQVEAWECQPHLVDAANALLRAEGFAPCVSVARRDEVPEGSERFAAYVVGWAAYSLVRGRAARLAFLRDVRDHVVDGAPVLVSFLGRRGGDAAFRATAAVAAGLRRSSGRPPVEVGDDLQPNFVHQFTASEVEDEFSAAGFDVAELHLSADAWAVLVARPEDATSSRSTS